MRSKYGNQQNMKPGEIALDGLDHHNNEGNTILHILCKQQNYTKVEEILKPGGKWDVNIDVKNDLGQTPLMYALENPNLDILKLLIKHGAKVNDVMDNNSMTAIDIAKKPGANRSLELLLRAGAEDPSLDWNKLHYLVHFTDDPQILSDYLEKNDCSELIDAKLYNCGLNSWLIKSGSTPLQLLCSGKYYDNTEQYISNGSSNNDECNDDNSSHVQFEKAKVLLAHGADVNSEDDTKKWTPLQWVCSMGCSDKVIQLLCENGAREEAGDNCNGGESPLFLACVSNSVKAVRLLLTNGANKEVKNKTGETPLIYAVRHNYTDVVQALITARCDINTKFVYNNDKLLLQGISGNMIGKELTGFVIALNNGYTSIARLFINAGVSLDYKSKDGGNVLHLAAAFHDASFFHDLLRFNSGIDVNKRNTKGNTPLHVFCMKPLKQKIIGYFELPKKVNSALKTIMKAVALNGHMCNVENQESMLSCSAEQLAKVLVDAKVDVNLENRESYNPLFLATIMENDFAVEMLISAGARFDTEVPDCWPLCHIATFNKDLKTLNLLLKAGCNVDLITSDEIDAYGYNYNNMTAIELAYTLGYYELADMFLDKGACNFANPGNTILHEVIISCTLSTSRKIEILGKLYKKGIDINQVNEYGSTPLQISLKAKLLSVSIWLIKHGADINKVDNYGSTTLHYFVLVAGPLQKCQKRICCRIKSSDSVLKCLPYIGRHASDCVSESQMYNVIGRNFISQLSDLEIRKYGYDDLIHEELFYESQLHDVFQVILTKSSNVNALNGNQEMALHSVCRYNNNRGIYMLKALLEHVNSTEEVCCTLKLLMEHYHNSWLKMPAQNRDHDLMSPKITKVEVLINYLIMHNVPHAGIVIREKNLLSALMSMTQYGFTPGIKRLVYKILLDISNVNVPNTFVDDHWLKFTIQTGQMPMEYAAEKFKYFVIPLLFAGFSVLDYGSETNSTALQIAMRDCLQEKDDNKLPDLLELVMCLVSAGAQLRSGYSGEVDHFHLSFMPERLLLRLYESALIPQATCIHFYTGLVRYAGYQFQEDFAHPNPSMSGTIEEMMRNIVRPLSNVARLEEHAVIAIRATLLKPNVWAGAQHLKDLPAPTKKLIYHCDIDNTLETIRKMDPWFNTYLSVLNNTQQSAEERKVMICSDKFMVDADHRFVNVFEWSQYKLPPPDYDSDIEIIDVESDDESD